MDGFVHLHVPDHERRYTSAATATRIPAATRIVSVPAIHAVDTAALAKAGVSAIITRSDGYDHLPLGRLQASGIACYHLADYASDAVAEHTVGLLWMLAAQIPQAHAATRAGTWDRAPLRPRRLCDLRVGIVGTGSIGKRVVNRLLAMGVDVAGHDIAPDPALDIPYMRLDALAAWADALSLHVPLTEATRGLIGAHLLRPGALLVNTSRGAVVDEAAVASALADGSLGGYAADVIASEPEPTSLAAFQGLGNAVFTPHIAAYDAGTIQTRYRLAETIAATLLAGEDAPRYEVPRLAT